MSAEILGTADGILTLKITGKLSQPELREAQKAASDVFQSQGKMRVLILADGFQGWEREGDWGDLSFQVENDAFVEKMAIVGEKKWEELALLFAAQGFRQFPVEYFSLSDAAKANDWLAAAS